MVTKSTLEQVLADNNVKMTRHEFETLCQMCMASAHGEVINYQKMSELLNLHSKKLSMI